MIKFLTITKTGWFTFFAALLTAFMMAAITFAQTPSDSNPEDVAAQYDVTFPIAELGGCTDLTSCRTYCEDSVNSSSCISYAKQKGFYQEDKFEVKDNTLATAKSQLGCDSYASCLNFCEVPANFDKCDAFAKSQGLVGGHVGDPSRTQVIARAREVLGCDSQTGCQSYCSLEENRQKCSEFAKEVGLRGGKQQVGPGGCTSEATCKSFCSDPQNFQICSGFTSTSGGTFTGPGGCNSEASCRIYCQEHENECRTSFGGPGIEDSGSLRPGYYNPQEMCNRTPNCSWAGSTCQCGYYGETEESRKKAGEYAAFCKANPDKCKTGQPGSFDNTQQRQEFEKYCRENPDKCKLPGGGSSGPGGDPATECSSIPRCSWTGSTCDCTYIPPAGPEGCPDGQYIGPGGYCISGSGTSSTPSPGTGTSCPQGQYIGPGGYCIPSSGGTYSPAPASTYQPSYDPATECTRTSGCSWTGSTCQCSSTGGSSDGTTTSTAPQPTSEPAPTSQPSSTESTPPPSDSSGESSGGDSSGSCPAGSYMQDGACVQGVYGVSSKRSLLEQILDFLRF